ncbi:MAG: 3'-5' exoribonuclease [Chloroflexi bacterium]|nr:3'-5' exoribonuclease [Chloroflexota bacterium]
MNEVCVALDLETTGLDPARDEIIEIGAVRFRGNEILGTYETLVNPGRAVPEFVRQLTGISQRDVDAAPPLSAVAEDMLAFVGDDPVVGHNVGFDLRFLEKAGLRRGNSWYDTLELASAFIPQASDYSLTGLARALGISHGKPHRALEDARLSHKLYLELLRRASEMAPGVLAAIGAITGRSDWGLRGLLVRLEAVASERQGDQAASADVGVMGLDMDDLKGRLSRPTPVRVRRDVDGVDEEYVVSLLEEGGALSLAMEGFEHRPQQVEMAQAVTRALNEGHRLLVEAGTGVGKSLAYLLPAMLFAVRNGQRVVVSTNTINLQEQLVGKDIPAIVEALESEPGGPLSGFRFAHLKGRANYLCYRRWSHMAQSGDLSADDARMMAKTLVWLQGTATGDRAEMRVPARDMRAWDQISARGAGDCNVGDGVCFLRTARARAEGAHVVVVNHALLLSDLASGGSVIPHYDHLIVDEAHHLEDEASRQFGFQVQHQAVDDLAAQLGQWMQLIRAGVRAAEPSRRAQVEQAASGVEGVVSRVRESWARLTSAMAGFVEQHQEPGTQESQLRITLSTRKQPGWSDLEVEWERFNETLEEAGRLVDRLLVALEPLDTPILRDPKLELETWLERREDLKGRVESFVVHPEEEYVYWITLSGQEGLPTLSASPLRIGPMLDEMLYSKKRTVVLTSATLSIEGSMEYVKERVGLKEPEELVLGSPFDYRKAALVLTCDDVPEPGDGGYQQAIQDVLVRVARASGGGVLALFTSHASLRTARQGTKAVLEAEGIPVLAQGIDGSPAQLVEAASERGNAVLLGTSSLWEGVDIPGDPLRVVVLTRLPFNVPTEPVFAARSEEFANPFNEYAVPQAVLRFRQGFGRLIRSRHDRGVVIVLDRRVVSRRYGGSFLRSLPECTMKQVPMNGLAEEVRVWLKGRGSE